MNHQETRREIITAARRYIDGEPGSEGVADAYRQMYHLLRANFVIERNDMILWEIAQYLYNENAEEKDMLQMARYVSLPDCPVCGIDGSTSFHPDSTDNEPVLICMFCGHIGYGAVQQEAS